MNTPARHLESELAAARRDLEHLQQALCSVVVGQQPLIDDLVNALAAGGHVLLEGLPGLGKTHLAKGLARCLGLDLARVQCTPDLMPADVTGSELLLRGADGHQHMDFRPGPLFAHLVLVDEINRATPKTQSALLEAMQEAQVTYGGVRHALPRPFWVLATQNPIEIEGTYPLPEAQLDRFLVKLRVACPEADALLALLAVSLDREPADQLPVLLDRTRIARIMELAREILVAEPLRRSAVALVLATQPGHPQGDPESTRHLRYGASPRGLQALVRVARVRALRQGRVHVTLQDLERAALPTLRHRLLPSVEAELEGLDTDLLLRRILERWRERQ